MRTRSATALAPIDRDKLARLLGMLGSDYAGERDTAARMAAQFVRQRGITWFDVLGIPVDPGSRPQPSTDDPLHGFDTMTACSRFVLAETPLLTEWERAFVMRLPGFTRLSPKQLDILRRLVDRAIAAGAVP